MPSVRRSPTPGTAKSRASAERRALGGAVALITAFPGLVLWLPQTLLR